MNPLPAPKTIVVCDMQPIVIEGVRLLLETSPDLRFGGSVGTLLAAMELVRSSRPTVLLMDKSLGFQPIVDWLPGLRGGKTSAVVWGAALTNAEALRLVQAGVRGILQKTAPLDSIMSCLRAAADGVTWMPTTIYRSPEQEPRTRSNLTNREQQVVELVERGMRNKEIAHELGIRTGTVKIHLKHIFEKTGCKGRYGLAISGLREKSGLEMSIM
jgi:DNA-binding NarL/FixJ family response regulator